ncbi:Zn-dependent exopeptidase [Annulohypoxylon maeteangense]|uniref:Zn-dependent exopeptidase n=1 Tax=Annulohypoxylon maeteangense TaxID=1927788 RepID=UPI00200808EC|nr:Zn-dependent exopeptidase [Annulohypoxylon maeteangense]KAI0890758.1 Zn-dependent exopeptidase [Annulohypoxylon maeteangense]
MKLLSLSVLLLSSCGALGSDLQKPLVNSPSYKSSDESPSYRDNLVSLHKSLVEISSISGNENEVGTFLVDYLTARGYTVQCDSIPSSPDSDNKPSFNVLAWPGSNPHPSPKILVSSHIDTVPPFIPYSINDSSLNPDTLIAGRGSVDAKASVAAQIIALESLLDTGAVDDEDGSIMLLYVVGEETSGVGMRHFSESHGNLDPAPEFKAAIFGEPTEGRLVCGHKGIFGCNITAHGHAGHSGYPWLGKSATEVLMRGLVRVLETDLGSSEEFGNTTVNIGLIEGGVAANVIPERATARLAVRVAIGPELDGAKIASDRLIEVMRSVDDEAFEFDCNYGYGVVKCDCDVEGFETTTVNYGTDVHNLEGNHTRYLYGPGTIFVAHGPDEAIKLGDLETAVEDYKKLILHALES